MKMTTNQHIILIDDDEDAILSLLRTLKSIHPEFSFSAATTETAALKLIREVQPSVVVTDLCIDEKKGPQSGYELIQKILTQDSTIRVIVLTGFGSVEAGVQCLELGAASFIEKPADITHLSALIKDSASQANLKRSYSELNQKLAEPALYSIIGSSELTKKLRESVHYAASTNQSILISGETGTGKGLCALAIHKLSRRNNKHFVRYQPNFSTADLVNSDLFGHQKGAFTGADANRAGLIEEANGGTLFLDEIDELPLETQVSLLGALQEKRFRPLGSNREVEIDFRLLSATNQNPEQVIAEKKLRPDFFHRIAHFQIQIPPLRDRVEDICDLAYHFLARLRENERVNVFELSSDVVTKLQNYLWPGNIRELQAVVEGGAYRAQFNGATTIEKDHIELGTSQVRHTTSTNFHEQVEDYKLKLINDALTRNNGNQVKASLELGLDRTSLRRILKRN